jgi:hypothetical protein
MDKTRIKQIRIREDSYDMLRELAKIIQQERGMFGPHLGVAAEIAIREALQKREEAQGKVSQKQKPR